MHSHGSKVHEQVRLEEEDERVRLHNRGYNQRHQHGPEAEEGRQP